MDPLKAKTDEELVIDYAIGNNHAFDELLRRHQKNVYNYIFFIIKNREMAEDVFQDTFVKAIINIKQGRYIENGKFKAWIMRIAHNLIIDYFRLERNENTVSNDEMEVDLLNDAALCDITIEDKMVWSQILTDVKRLVEYLPDNQRDVLEMRYYHDLSFKEIADQVGVSINTALGRMRYAIINLRKLAEENGIILHVS